VKFIYKTLFLLLSIALTSSCARTGRPDGGPKDELAPLFVTSNPPYKTINFSKKEVKLEFNEFIKLKDLNKQLENQNYFLLLNMYMRLWVLLQMKRLNLDSKFF